MLFLHRKKKNKKEPGIITEELIVEKNNSDFLPHDRFIRCLCCGTLQQITQNHRKFKCNVCQTSNSITRKGTLQNNSAKISGPNEHLFATKDRLAQIIGKCKANDMNFEPLIKYLVDCFHDEEVLERSFYSFQNRSFINHRELDEFYQLLFELPTRKPLFRMLCACNDLLKNPLHRFENYRWIFIIFENPVIRTCLIVKDDNNRFNAFDIRAIAYEISKRCIGYLSNILESSKHKIYLQYLKNLETERFLNYVEIVNLYLTYQLRKLYENNLKENNLTRINKNTIQRTQNNTAITSNNNSNEQNAAIVATTTAISTNSNYNNIQNNNIQSNNIQSNTLQLSSMVANQNTNVREESSTILNTTYDNNIDLPQNDNSQIHNNIIQQDILHTHMKDGTYMKDSKGVQIVIKPHQYQNKWHITTATKLMYVFFKIVNDKRSSHLKLHTNDFYNSLLDFIDYKLDFQKSGKVQRKDEISDLFSIDKSKTNGFAFSDYPFLLSLGLKISIMGFEIRRTMEYQAELAFLHSIDQHKYVPVYFRIKVRRKFLVIDSLNSIKEQQNNLLKALRVEFIGEMGIDAGGLRKEWFILLSKELFNRENYLFDYIKESGFSWFTIGNDKSSKFMKSNNLESLYFLTGVVFGLALYNGVILELNFPNLFYKKICNEALRFDDFMELYPEVGSNLKKLLEYEEDDFVSIFGLTFETTVKIKDDKNGYRFEAVELCENGASKFVTRKNKREYINLWIDYYLNKSIAGQFQQFMTGFNKVFQGCDSIKLFDFEELKRLLCGDQCEDKSYDFNMLRSITKYNNGFCNKSLVVEWFWEIINDWEPKFQSKFLQFVTGSNKIPATGMSTLCFKITRVKSEGNNLLPIAHTCFNELALCDYQSKKILEYKLFTAITESKGFEFK